ncbi:MAG: MBL fold metallo-hydrolase [Candidatus Aminicenantes bacterium]|nr:MBL fold metallo-hydrolase [Candidatus Aminicenantes bacterium]
MDSEPKKSPQNESQAFLKFLGTAGARFVVARQLRSSAGLYLEVKGKRLIIDPGPGTLVKLNKVKPKIDVEKIDGLILTHGHIDHANDVNILIDAMTQGGLKRQGWLFAPQECLEGDKAVVFNYLKKYLEKIVPLKPEAEYSIGELSWRTSIRHLHPVETYGLIFKIDTKKLALVADTKYFPELINCYQGSDWLVLNVVRDTPFEDPSIQHLVLDDARKMIKEIKPKLAILTHFGMAMLRARPWELADKLEKELGLKIIAASDGLTLPLT